MRTFDTLGSHSYVNSITYAFWGSLCFIHASTSEIAAAALDPTLPDQERASNQAFDAAHNLQGETLVAFALKR